MGNGNRSGELLNFQVTANYGLTDTDHGLWERAFSKASELLWNATEGQLRFGTIWVNNNNVGTNNAEFVLDPETDGRAFASGRWGRTGAAIFLPAYAQRQVLSILHELGHLVWSVKDEYAYVAGMSIDREADLDDSLPGDGTVAEQDRNKIIPLVGQDNPPLKRDSDFVGADAILYFNDLAVPAETRAIESKSGNWITTVSPFTLSALDSSYGSVTLQWAADCTGDVKTGACIMQYSRGNAGLLEADGTWIARTHPVTEFCTEFNHDPEGDTNQSIVHQKSCWETIVSTGGFTDLSGPPSGSAASKILPTGWSPPDWVVMAPRARLALVLDRSGSMNRNGGARLRGVQLGSKYWIETGAVENDQLTVVWYDNNVQVRLPLADFRLLSESDIARELDSIDNQTAAGGTNILGGLNRALGQLTGSDGQASVQAAILITDGAHNAAGRMLDAIAPYRAANTNIHTLGVGRGAEMDLPGLAVLARETGGTAEIAGNGDDAAAIQASMIEVSAAIRGGMVSSAGSGGGDTWKAHDQLDNLVRKGDDFSPEERPTLDQLVQEFDLSTFEEAFRGGGHVPHRYTWHEVQVEEGARSVTFTLSYAESAKFWLYLIDPNGNEIHPLASNVVAWSSGQEPYEFVKIERPEPGRWLVVGVRLDRGAAEPTKVIAAIDHPEVSVFAEAVRVGPDSPIRLRAGAKCLTPLTGLSVVARARRPRGPWHTIDLHDRMGDGEYEAWADLPGGGYSGHIEIRSPDNPLVANAQHALLHAESPSEIGDARVEVGAFVRHVQLSFVADEFEDPSGGIPEDEKPPREDGGKLGEGGEDPSIGEKKRREEEARLRFEQSKLREDETRLREEEARLRVDEGTQRVDEARLRFEQSKLREDETRLREEEARLRVDEGRQRVDEAKRRVDAGRRRVDEAKAGVDEAHLRDGAVSDEKGWRNSVRKLRD